MRSCSAGAEIAVPDVMHPLQRILQSHVGDHCTAGWWCPVQWSTTLLNSTMHRTAAHLLCVFHVTFHPRNRDTWKLMRRETAFYFQRKNGQMVQSSKVRTNCNNLMFLSLIFSLRTLTKGKHLKITHEVLPKVINRSPSQAKIQWSYFPFFLKLKKRERYKG